MIQGKEKKKENGETFLNRPQHPTTATEALGLYYVDYD